MPFGLCNVPASVQHCMTSIFHELIKDSMEVFMDGFSVFELDIEIHDKKGAENLAADHLSRIENPYLGKLTKAGIRDLFLEERLMAVSDNDNEPWYADYANYLASRSGPSRGHHGIATIARKVFDAGFYWPHIFRDARRIIYGKACHLSVELEHKAYWVIKNCNMDLTKVGANRVKSYQNDVLEADKHEDITLDDEGEVT
nr:hypothetical protein [Tanacetum cinerariifolium]